MEKIDLNLLVAVSITIFLVISLIGPNIFPLLFYWELNWDKHPIMDSYVIYSGDLRVEWSGPYTGANKPIIQTFNGSEYIPLLEFSSWTTSLKLTYENGSEEYRNLFFDHLLHVYPYEKSLIAVWFYYDDKNKKIEYKIEMKTQIIDSDKVSVSYSIKNSLSEIKNIDIILTNWRNYIKNVYANDTKVVLNGSNIEKIGNEYWITLQPVKRLGLEIEELENKYGLEITFNKPPNTLKLVAEDKGFRTIQIVASLDTEFVENIKFLK